MDHTASVRHLRRVDPPLRAVIDHVGPCQLSAQGGRFSLLARSILSQQISVSAARTIRRQLQRELPGGRFTPEGLLALSDSQFQAAGVSRQKRTYLQHLAQQAAVGKLNFRRLPRLDDEDVIGELTQVKGVGRWTAQMFLIFGLGRPDVFAPADMGLQNAMRLIYQLKDPSTEELEAIAACWSPCRSVASWYLWRFADNPPDAG